MALPSPCALLAVAVSSGVLSLGVSSARLSWPDRFYPPDNRAGSEAYEDWTARSLEGRIRFLHPTVGVDFGFGEGESHV
jgi:hypothetical protein